MYYKITLLAVLTVTGLEARHYPLMKEHLSSDSIVYQRCLESSEWTNECAKVEAFFAHVKTKMMKLAQPAENIDADATKNEADKQHAFLTAFGEHFEAPSEETNDITEAARKAVLEIISSEKSEEIVNKEHALCASASESIMMQTLATFPLAARFMQQN